MAIIIADDLATARRFHRRWLQAQASWPDSAFIEASTLQAAIDAARDNDVDLVILDLHFPEAQERGVETLRRFLRESGVPAKRIYVSTADSDNAELVAACLSLGVAEVSNSGQPSWSAPPQTCTSGQIEALDKRITDSVKKIIREEFASLQREQAERDKLKQAEGILTALRVVAGVVAGALGTWLLNVAFPPAWKALIAGLMSLATGGKSGPP